MSCILPLCVHTLPGLTYVDRLEKLQGECPQELLKLPAEGTVLQHQPPAWQPKATPSSTSAFPPASAIQAPSSGSIFSRDKQYPHSHRTFADNQPAAYSAGHPTHLQPSPEIYPAALQVMPVSATLSHMSGCQMPVVTQSCSGQQLSWGVRAPDDGGICSGTQSLSAEAAYATSQPHQNTRQPFLSSSCLSTLHEALAG